MVWEQVLRSRAPALWPDSPCRAVCQWVRTSDLADDENRTRYEWRFEPTGRRTKQIRQRREEWRFCSSWAYDVADRDLALRFFYETWHPDHGEISCCSGKWAAADVLLPKVALSMTYNGNASGMNCGKRDCFQDCMMNGEVPNSAQYQ